eukprot:COSAG06_NODE_1308_length_9914_cov_6.225879_4_plen_108_part_00
MKVPYKPINPILHSFGRIGAFTRGQSVNRAVAGSAESILRSRSAKDRSSSRGARKRRLPVPPHEDQPMHRSSLTSPLLVRGPHYTHVYSLHAVYCQTLLASQLDFVT